MIINLAYTTYKPCLVDKSKDSNITGNMRSIDQLIVNLQANQLKQTTFSIAPCYIDRRFSLGF